VTTLSPNQLSKLMSLMAHDLRNPLSALLTNVNFIRSALRGRAPELQDALSDAAVSCSVLGQVIGNLDILSRAFSGPEAARHPTPAGPAADEAVARFASQAELVGVAIEVVSSDGTPFLLVEPGFFGRALDNLVANAIQHSPIDGKVRIECVASGDRGSVIVTDDGPTVPPELRAIVLTLDGQGLAEQPAEVRYGRGVGLYCAAQAARIAGAELRVGERAGRAVLELSALLAERA
jgi:signal transduction histidine kinase